MMKISRSNDDSEGHNKACTLGSIVAELETLRI